MKKLLLLLIMPLLMGAGCSNSSNYQPTVIKCEDYNCDGPYGCPEECDALRHTDSLNPDFDR